MKRKSVPLDGKNGGWGQTRDQPASAPSSSPGLFRLSSLPFSKKKALGTNLTIRMQVKALNYFTFANHANKDKRQISHTCLESSLESKTGHKTLLFLKCDTELF